MKSKRMVSRIGDIKTYEDLRELMLRRKYELEMEQIKFESMRIQLRTFFTPENIKESLLLEGKHFLQLQALKFFGKKFAKIFKG